MREAGQAKKRVWEGWGMEGQAEVVGGEWLKKPLKKTQFIIARGRNNKIWQIPLQEVERDPLKGIRTVTHWEPAGLKELQEGRGLPWGKRGQPLWEWMTTGKRQEGKDLKGKKPGVGVAGRSWAWRSQGSAVLSRSLEGSGRPGMGVKRSHFLKETSVILHLLLAKLDRKGFGMAVSPKIRDGK